MIRDRRIVLSVFTGNNEDCGQKRCQDPFSPRARYGSLAGTPLTELFRWSRIHGMKKSSNGRLEESTALLQQAMATLLQNQATLAHTQATLVQNQALFVARVE